MDQFILSIITLGNVICLLFGLHQLYKFIRAIIEKKSFLKCQAFLLNSFWLIIIIPALYTMGAISISNMFFPGAGSVAFVISAEDNRASPIIYLEEDIKINVGEEELIDLSVISILDHEVNLFVELSCQETDVLCPDIKENIQPKTPHFRLKPKVAIKLPIRIKVIDQWENKDVHFNINVSYINGTNYASLPLKISVGN